MNRRNTVALLTPLLMAPAYVVPYCYGEQGYIRPIMVEYDEGPGARCRWDEGFIYDGHAVECVKR